MEFINFPIVRFCILYCSGIFIQDSLPFDLDYIIWGLVCCCVSFFIPGSGSKIFISIGCVFLGMLSLELKSIKHNPNHYSYGIEAESAYLVEFETKKLLKETPKMVKFLGKINSIDSIKYEGDFIGYIRKGIYNGLQAGGTFKSIMLFKMPTYNSPSGFNYQKYLAHKQITHLGFIYNNQHFQYISKKLPLWIRAKNWLVNQIKTSDLNATSKSLVLAILLAERSELDPNLQIRFQNAGISHILAISGLHIGIIILLLNHLWTFFWGGKHPKIKSLMMLLILWGYVLLIGYPTSVVRASLMFSILILGRFLSRETHTINNLFLSSLILLILNPYFLFDVGFQLSYSAVFFILWIYPKLNAHTKLKNPIKRNVVQLSLVSILAQVGTLPFVIYYFHGFQPFSIIPNLLIIPLVYLFILFGMAFLVSIWLEGVSSFFGIILNNIGKSIETLSFYSSKMRFMMVENIHLNSIQALMLFSIIFSLGLFIRNKNYWALISALGITISWQILILLSA